MHKKSLFIFRRDLRTIDNTALLFCDANSNEVIPIFIFDPIQTSKHEYFSTNGFKFLLESLLELDNSLKQLGSKLHIYEGNPINVISEFSNTYPEIDSVYFNDDYTKYSVKRDEEIKVFLDSKGIGTNKYHDLLLNPPGSVLKKDDSPYVKFTPFYKKSLELQIAKPKNTRLKNLIRINDGNKNLIEKFAQKFELKLNKEFDIRETAIKKLTHLDKNYSENRDFPFIDSTSKLSRYHKFGNISIRETYAHAKKTNNDKFISELYWRDFYSHIAYFFPKVFNKSFNSKFDNIQWENDEKKIEAWKNGNTGYPIVDAGIRELNKTGFMHNRVRMIVASFLTKHLRVNWRIGEQYFANHLTDYDPCSNNGGWQWAASTGCDSQPYFRIFNPWLQQIKFDKNAKYIKKWVKELKEVSTHEIHEEHSKERIKGGYVKPMVVHSEEREKTLKMFREVK